MWNLNEVSQIEYRGNYVYRIVFADGLEGDMDFSEYLDKGPCFSAAERSGFFPAGADRRRHHRMAQRGGYRA